MEERHRGRFTGAAVLIVRFSTQLRKFPHLLYWPSEPSKWREYCSENAPELVWRHNSGRNLPEWPPNGDCVSRKIVATADMPELKIETFAIAIEGTFAKPVPFLEAQCDVLAKACLEKFGVYRLQPTQISVRRRDQVFNYDLSFQLFNGNGTFKISADRFSINLQNGRGKDDYNIMTHCISAFYEVIPIAILSFSTITATGHTLMVSPDSVQKYFSEFRNDKVSSTLTGVIGTPVHKPWPHKMKLMLEESALYPNGLFFSFVTDYPAKISQQIVEQMVEAVGACFAHFNLHFIQDQPKAN